MSGPEFSRVIDVRQVDGHRLQIAADEAECAALAKRFDLVSVGSLEASVLLEHDGDGFRAKGRMTAEIVQACAVSAEDLPVSIAEDIALRFVPVRASHLPEAEVELDSSECDEIEFTGTSFDLGEAVAQSLGLTIDPFATSPAADTARSLLGEAGTSPFAALKGLNFKD